MGRQRRSRNAAIASVEHARHLFGRKPALPDLEQSSRDRPHHVLKKAISPDPKSPLTVGALPRCVVYGPGAVLDLSRCRAKRGEVVGTEKICSAAIEKGFVERITKRVDVPAVKRADDGISPNVVLVRLRSG